MDTAVTLPSFISVLRKELLKTEKAAVTIDPEVPMWKRPVSSTVGRAFSPIYAALLGSTYPLRPGPSRQDIANEHSVKTYDDSGDYVDTPELNITPNRVKPIQNIKRLWQRKDVSIPTKLLGTVVSPMSDAATSLMRADHYNPFSHSVTVYGKDPAVLAHELGHAKDYGSYKQKLMYMLSRSIPPVTLYQEYKASENAIPMLEAKDRARAQRVLGGGLGSYVGGPYGAIAGQAIGAVAHPFGGIAATKGTATKSVDQPNDRNKKEKNDKTKDENKKSAIWQPPLKTAAGRTRDDAPASHSMPMTSLQKRRPLTPEEEAAIKDRERRWHPAIFTDFDTPAVNQIASPRRMALIGALLGAAGGALTGGVLGARATGLGKDVNVRRSPNAYNDAVQDTTMAALLGGAAGAPLGGISAYLSQRNANKKVKRLLQALPANATMGDWHASPVVRAYNEATALPNIKIPELPI